MHYDASSGPVSLVLKPDGNESRQDTAWLSRLTRAGSARDGRVILFLDGSTPSGPPSVTPAASLAAALAQAQAAIATLRSVAAGTTSMAAAAQADLAAIARAAEPSSPGN